jgi:hypothetical protein
MKLRIPSLLALALLLTAALPGAARAQCPEDGDGDGYVVGPDGPCEQPGCCLGGGDCDDRDPYVHPAAPELCDGVDNDCDDLTDEEFPDLGQACDGQDADQCPDGHWACGADQESLTCVEPGEGRTEVCNGLDDDCDGETDEDWLDLGQACDGLDADLCAAGVWICAPSGQALECQDNVLEDDEEICNGLDDDCDGETDEDLGPYVCGLGMCQVAAVRCLAGVPQTCTPTAPPEPGQELSCADGLDNDCDGYTDEEDAIDCGKGGGGCDGCRSAAGLPRDAALPAALLLGLWLIFVRRR